MSVYLIRRLLKLLTIRLKVYKPGEEPVRTPSKFMIFSHLPPSELLEKLADAYCQVFSEEPWHEKHSRERVIEKLKREVNPPNVRLVIMEGDKTTLVAGFCWGGVITPDQIPERVAQARFPEDLQRGKEKVKKLLEPLGDKKLLFLDELAVLKPFRKGPAPIQFLLRPLFELGWENNIKSVLFWTSEKSKIKALATYMGFSPLSTINEITFMFNPDFAPLLKIVQNWESKQIEKILTFTSFLARKRS
jgi:hypothetical protein